MTRKADQLLAGQPECAEDEEAAGHINRFLAESVARACRYNKSHACFEADLQAHINEPMVKPEYRTLLKGLNTYRKVG